jgi:hypothetical protein
LGFDGLVNTGHILNAKELERQIEAKQLLIRRSAAIALRRRHEEILQDELILWSKRVVGLIGYVVGFIRSIPGDGGFDP